MSDWQPIETAPKDGTWTLVAGNTRTGRVSRSAHWDAESEAWLTAVSTIYPVALCLQEVTHWMPLPAPPEVSNA